MSHPTLTEWYDTIPFTETLRVLGLLYDMAPDDEWRRELSAIGSEFADREFVYERLMDTVFLFSDEGEPEKLTRMPAPVWTWYERAMRASHLARLIERNRQRDEQRSAPDAITEIFGGPLLFEGGEGRA